MFDPSPLLQMNLWPPLCTRSSIEKTCRFLRYHRNAPIRNRWVIIREWNRIDRRSPNGSILAVDIVSQFVFLLTRVFVYFRDFPTHFGVINVVGGESFPFRVSNSISYGRAHRSRFRRARDAHTGGGSGGRFPADSRSPFFYQFPQAPYRNGPEPAPYGNRNTVFGGAGTAERFPARGRRQPSCRRMAGPGRDSYATPRAPEAGKRPFSASGRRRRFARRTAVRECAGPFESRSGSRKRLAAVPVRKSELRVRTCHDDGVTADAIRKGRDSTASADGFSRGRKTSERFVDDRPVGGGGWSPHSCIPVRRA